MIIIDIKRNYTSVIVGGLGSEWTSTLPTIHVAHYHHHHHINRNIRVRLTYRIVICQFNVEIVVVSIYMRIYYYTIGKTIEN